MKQYDNRQHNNKIAQLRTQYNELLREYDLNKFVSSFENYVQIVNSGGYCELMDLLKMGEERDILQTI